LTLDVVVVLVDYSLELVEVGVHLELHQLARLVEFGAADALEPVRVLLVEVDAVQLLGDVHDVVHDVHQDFLGFVDLLALLESDVPVFLFVLDDLLFDKRGRHEVLLAVGVHHVVVHVLLLILVVLHVVADFVLVDFLRLLGVLGLGRGGLWLAEGRYECDLVVEHVDHDCAQLLVEQVVDGLDLLTHLALLDVQHDQTFVHDFGFHVFDEVVEAGFHVGDVVLLELLERLDLLQFPAALAVDLDPVPGVEFAVFFHVVNPELLERDGEVTEDGQVVRNLVLGVLIEVR